MFKKYLEAGKIVNTHGINGEVKIQPWCDTPKSYCKFDGFFLDDGKTFIKAEKIRLANTLLIVKFEGIDDVNSASHYRNKTVYLDREWLKLPKGTYFEQDLLGLSVVDINDGTVYGTVGEVSRTGANDIYRVDNDGKEIWIPAINDVVKTVDLENGKLMISPLKGLFDDED